MIPARRAGLGLGREGGPRAGAGTVIQCCCLSIHVPPHPQALKCQSGWGSRPGRGSPGGMGEGAAGGWPFKYTGKG